ncbi:MAG: transaldolase, partial [Anaerolineae bacterium]
MTTNPLRELVHRGQSVWLDQLRRDWLTDGTMARWIEDDGVRGLTSNPSIFAWAITNSDCYDEQTADLAVAGREAEAIYDKLTVDDIRAACQLLLPVYKATSGADGYVSHEVSPELARDTWGTIHEARRLWRAIDRPNVMIKIPATPEGMPAIEKALGEGININVTLLFSLSQYEAVTEAHAAGLEARHGTGRDISTLASVASFFVSRVDTKVDAALQRRLAALSTVDGAEAEALEGLLGKAAVANALRAYSRYQAYAASDRFAALEAVGARKQRVLWASTSTKNPDYSDVKYVEELVAPDTVNTLPLKTLEAFRDHGRVTA